MLKQECPIQPLGDKIVVLPEEEPDERESGLIIPEVAKQRPVMGKVLATGQGLRMSDGSFYPLDIKVGDKVLYAKFTGNTVALEEAKYLIMRQADVLAIVEEDGKE